MHAYLVVGEGETAEGKVAELSDKLKGRRMDFSLQKISDIRELTNFTRLKLSEKTLIVSKNIDTASIEAQNAFLKELEEPQETLSFILTAEAEDRVVPTIVSRCTVLRVKSAEDSKKLKEFTDEFIALPKSDKFLKISKINKREEAVDFLKKLIKGAHPKLVSDKKMVKFIEEAERALYAIQKNGNVQLQLTAFVVSID